MVKSYQRTDDEQRASDACLLNTLKIADKESCKQQRFALASSAALSPQDARFAPNAIHSSVGSVSLVSHPFSPEKFEKLSCEELEKIINVIAEVSNATVVSSHSRIDKNEKNKYAGVIIEESGISIAVTREWIEFCIHTCGEKINKETACNHFRETFKLEEEKCKKVNFIRGPQHCSSAVFLPGHLHKSKMLDFKFFSQKSRPDNSSSYYVTSDMAFADPLILNDAEKLIGITLESIKDSGLTPIDDPIVKNFEPFGVSLEIKFEDKNGETATISFHTWPERFFTPVDMRLPRGINGEGIIKKIQEGTKCLVGTTSIFPLSDPTHTGSSKIKPIKTINYKSTECTPQQLEYAEGGAKSGLR